MTHERKKVQKVKQIERDRKRMRESFVEEAIDLMEVIKKLHGKSKTTGLQFCH